MPTYEYMCPAGHRFDRFQRMSDPPEADCPDCGAAGTRQISGGAGFLFKGDGFYITDTRSADYRKKAGSETSATPAADGSAASPGAGKAAESKSSSDSAPSSGTSAGGASGSSSSGGSTPSGSD